MYKQKNFKSLFSFVALGAIYSQSAFGVYTQTNAGNAGYTVTQISETAYNQALTQSNAPVFTITQGNSSPLYYKYILPDLTVYQTGGNSALTGPTSYSGNMENGLFVYRDIDANGNLTLQKYTKNNSAATGVYQNTYTSVNGNFYYVTGSGAIHVHDTNDPISISGNFIGNNNTSGGGAIYTNTNTNISSISGNFIYNHNGANLSGTPGGGAIYIMGGNVGSINANFIGNYSLISGGAIHNNGNIGDITGDFVYNYAKDFSYGNGAGIGAAIYNSGTIGTIHGDFIANGHGTAVYNTGQITAISGNFIGNTGAIYNSGTIGIVVPDDGELIFGTSSDTISNTGTLNFSGAGDIYVQNISGAGLSRITSADVTLANDASISQNTLLINSGSLTANATGLQTNTITNNGTINLTGGTLSKNISGTGTTNIKGTVTSNNLIDQSMHITGTLSIAANNIGGNVVNSNTLNLSSGALSHSVTGSGHTYIDGTVNASSTISNIIVNNSGNLTIAASDWDYVTNNGTLNLTTGEIEGLKHIYGNGTTNLSGNITASASVFSSTHIVNSGQLTLTGGFLHTPIYGTGQVINTGSLYVSADNVGSDITNNDWVGLSSGTLQHGIYGGTIMIAESYSVSSLANYLGNSSTTINNYGPIYLTGGTLYGHLNGDGDINISNTVTTSASNFGSSSLITNNGTLNLTGGWLLNNLAGTGNVVISGSVLVGNDMNQPISVTNTGTLSITPSLVHTNITNNGTVDLSNPGTLTHVISGTGNTNIAGHNVTTIADNLQTTVNVNNFRTLTLTGGTVQNTISGQGNVVNSGTLNSLATYLQNNNFTNNGTLNLTGGTLVRSISGTGNTNIKSNVTIGANNLELQNITLDENVSLVIGSNTLNAQNTVLNGTVQINITDLTKNSSVYSGGQLNVDGDLYLGDNSALQLVINPTALNEHEQTAELSIINVSGNRYGTFGQIVANDRYDIRQENDNYIISLGVTLDDIIGTNGGNSNEINAGLAWDTATFDSSSSQQLLQNNLWYLSQYNQKEYMQVLKNIVPVDTNVALVTAHSVNTAITNQFTHRLNLMRNKHTGRSGGDTNFDKLSLWAEGLYNMSEQTTSQTIDSNTVGVTLGGEICFNDKITVGLGYTNNSTTISASPIDIDATGHTVSVYGGYMFDDFYLDGILSLGTSNYKQKTDLGNSADYKATTFAINTLVGYKNAFENLPIIPELGLRYITTSVDSYEDAFGQKISYDDANTLTLIADAKYYQTINLNLKNAPAILVPEAKIGLAYDIMSSDNVVNVNLGNTGYIVNGEKLNPFGINFGIGTMLSFERLDFGLAYDLEWRNNFISHTGRVKVKYSF